MAEKLSGVIRGGCPGFMDINGNPQEGLRYEIDLSGFIERHLCPCDHCREVSGAPLADLIVVKKEAFKITQGQQYLATVKTKPRCRRERLAHTGCQVTVYVDVEGFDQIVLVHAPTIDKADLAKLPLPGRIVFIEDSTLPASFLARLGLPMYRGWVGHDDKTAQPISA